MFSPMDFHSEMARFRRHMNNIFNDFNRSFPFDAPFAPFADWNQYFLEDFSRPAVEGSSEQKGSLTSEQKQPNRNAGDATGTNQMAVESTAQQRSDSSTLRNPASPGASASPHPSASPSGTALSTTNTQQPSDSEASTSAVRPWRWGGWGWGNNSLTPYSSSSSSFNAISIPRMDIVENSDNFQLNCDLPGMSKDNVKVSVTADGRLLINAERTEQQEQKDENAKYHRMERSYGKFKRSFVLPENVDAEGVKAKHEHGLLQITLPKKPKAEPKPDKQIPIS